ncbi:MAG: sulfotransferase [Candidatus Heimdallarchaeota archaeon]|nr:MAG: sulfotransferase [Candidatus Heimdallarchaeota archaeon]
MNWQPVIIIGAPRSGTNILRDSISEFPGVSTWPCDEINFIWKHGNISFPHDELSLELLTSSIQLFIRKQFEKIHNKTGCKIVLEKTCANTLRLDYVDKIFPDAKYIHILRDGRDAVESIIRCWKNPVNPPKYYLDKFLIVPPPDRLKVLWVILRKRFYFKKVHSWRSWGPEFCNLRNLLNEKRPLYEICAFQWLACVSKTLEFFEKIDPSRYFILKYENFVKNPKPYFFEIGKFLNISVKENQAEKIIESISQKNISKWKLSQYRQKVENIIPLISNMLHRLNYDI